MGLFIYLFFSAFFALNVNRFMKRLCPRGTFSAIGGTRRRNLLTFWDVYWYGNSYGVNIFVEEVFLLVFYYFHDILSPEYAFYALHGNAALFDLYVSLYLPFKWLKMSQTEYFYIWMKRSKSNSVDFVDDEKPKFYVSEPSFEPRRYINMLRQAHFLINIQFMNTEQR